METLRIETPDGLTLSAAHHPADEGGEGAVLLAHGITQDMDEGGMYVRLAEVLSAAGFDVVRFTFRGHGDSDGTDIGVTIGGELLDFETAFEHTRRAFDGPYFVVAKSFGAVPTCYSLDRYEEDIAGVVLWNPVLDVEGTFLEPTAEWGIENFTGEALERLEEDGRLAVGNGFEMGRVLYEELSQYDPGARFERSSVPALVIHGDDDDIVPYEDTRRVTEAKGAELHTIEGADHGFLPSTMPQHSVDGPREQDRRTVRWITEQLDER